MIFFGGVGAGPRRNNTDCVQALGFQCDKNHGGRGRCRAIEVEGAAEAAGTGKMASGGGAWKRTCAAGRLGRAAISHPV